MIHEPIPSHTGRDFKLFNNILPTSNPYGIDEKLSLTDYLHVTRHQIIISLQIFQYLN